MQPFGQVNLEEKGQDQKTATRIRPGARGIMRSFLARSAMMLQFPSRRLEMYD